MALELPFLKKKEKEKTEKRIREEIQDLQWDLTQNIGKKVKDPVGQRLKYYEFEQERFEKFQHRVIPTDFPAPERRFRIMLIYPTMNLQEVYHWFLKYIREMWGFEKTLKLTDTLAAAVGSSNFGNIQARIAAQQNQASQYLKGISEMVKGLFQIVRELRIIDERLQYYFDSDGDAKGNKEHALSSEIVLKGLWIDQVEGGAKNPGSVYGLSQTIGFTILPDLFFRIQVKDKKRLEKDVDKLNFNEKVKEVLKRKLRQYYEWKWRTKKELETRRHFEIRYMKQHYDTIKLYMSWVKPYLRNVQRLKMDEKGMDDFNIINAFETQLIEIESLFIRDDFGHAASCLSLHLWFRGNPTTQHHPDEYQHKGAMFSGLIDITLRAYAWDHDQIHRYEEYRKHDDIDLLSSISESVAQAMEALGDDLKKYLKEADPSLRFAGDIEKKKESAPPSAPGALEPFIAVFQGFAEIFKSFSGGPKPAKKEKRPKKEKKKNRKGDLAHERAHHYAAEAAWEAYYRFKMGPGGNLYWVE